MSANTPVLPLAAGTLVRAFASMLALVIGWLKKMAQRRRHWHQATTLAALDRRMLADMGITRADLQDAFSQPYWEDPTALLRERAIERRMNRAFATRPQRRPQVENGFTRPATDRPARHAI
jgi:uncharacterized protein YjiS (DUF1127 family)